MPRFVKTQGLDASMIYARPHEIIIRIPCQERALKADGGALAVVYGRGRCGESTLIQRTVGDNDAYLADQKEPALEEAQEHFSRAIPSIVM